MTPDARRVVLVTNGLTQAGAETQLVRLASALRHHGDEVGIVSILATEAFADELETLAIPVAHLRVRPPMRGPSAIYAGARVLRAWQPDALISFVYQANVLGRVAGQLAGVPVVISSVRNEHFGGRARELTMRATDRLCTITTTNSQVAAERLIARRVVARHRLVVIPNGVDLAPFLGAAASRGVTRSQLGIADTEFVWLAAGRLEPQKDYPNLFAALARCPAPEPQFRLLVAGQGRLRSDLERLAADLGLGQRVQFLGVRADIPQLMAACDAVVLSSRFEGLPNVVMEAMAGARPVVATRVGGAPELVDDGVSGVLVKPGDPRALADAMRRMMAAPESDRQAMGAHGQEAIAARFGLEAMGESWLRLLDRFLERPRSGPRAVRTRAVRRPMSTFVAGVETSPR